MLQYDTKHEEGELKDTKRAKYTVRVPSCESVKRSAWVPFESARDPNSIGHIFPITNISRVLSKDLKNNNGRLATFVQCPCLDSIQN